MNYRPNYAYVPQEILQEVQKIGFGSGHLSDGLSYKKGIMKKIDEYMRAGDYKSILLREDTPIIVDSFESFYSGNVDFIIFCVMEFGMPSFPVIAFEECLSMFLALDPKDAYRLLTYFCSIDEMDILYILAKHGHYEFIRKIPEYNSDRHQKINREIAHNAAHFGPYDMFIELDRFANYWLYSSKDIKILQYLIDNNRLKKTVNLDGLSDECKMLVVSQQNFKTEHVLQQILRDGTAELLRELLRGFMVNEKTCMPETFLPELDPIQRIINYNVEWLATEKNNFDIYVDVLKFIPGYPKKMDFFCESRMPDMYINLCLDQFMTNWSIVEVIKGHPARLMGQYLTIPEIRDHKELRREVMSILDRIKKMINYPSDVLIKF